MDTSAFPQNAGMQATLLLRRSHRLGESILWHIARQRWYWVDLLDPSLCCFDPATGETTERPLDLKPPMGSIAPTTDPDRVMVAHTNGLSVLHLNSLKLEPFCHPEAQRDAVIANDIKVDRWGRLWFGTSHAREQEPRGALWCVTPDCKAALGDVGFPVSNGPAFSPDGRTMYFNDSANRQTLAYDLTQVDPHPRNRRVFAQYTEEEGMPDGLTVDTEGSIWSAQWLGARIVRIPPDGTTKTHIPVAAANVTSVAFGGNQMSEMLITSATDGVSLELLSRYPATGSVFTLSPGVSGLPEPLFNLR